MEADVFIIMADNVDLENLLTGDDEQVRDCAAIKAVH